MTTVLTTVDVDDVDTNAAQPSAAPPTPLPLPNTDAAEPRRQVTPIGLLVVVMSAVVLTLLVAPRRRSRTRS